MKVTAAIQPKVTRPLLATILTALNSQPKFKAGALHRHFDKWSALTSDHLLLTTINGFKLDLLEFPRQINWPQQLLVKPQEVAVAQTLLQELLEKRVIEPTVPHPTGFVSNIFLREKRNSNPRLILNLKPLNCHVEYIHFKMTTFSSALELITNNCFMASLDLSDAYYSVNVAPNHRKFLQFAFEGQFFRFTCLANGVSSAPRTFTKLLKVPLSHLREHHNITITAYLDDLLLIADTPESLLKAIHTTLALLTSLGFTISHSKSVVHPTTTLQFLGFLINSITMTVTLAPGKAAEIKHLIQETLKLKTIKIRHFARLLGKLAATLPANRYGQVFIKRLESAKALALKSCSFSYEGKFNITDSVRHDLSWWFNNIDHIFRPVTTSNPNVRLFTDASFLGWGCFVPATNVKTGGRWGPAEGNQDINYLELTAVLLSLQACCNTLRHSHILINSDNTTTVVSINKQGSTHSANCNNVARQIWLWAINTSNWLSAAHCPGVDNVEADSASRIFNDTTEWSLQRETFQSICRRLGNPTLDCFASRLNAQLATYCAWQPDPGAMAIDSFTLDWSEFKLIYVFPPFSVVGRVLQKIVTDRAEAIVIIPHWPTQPWFSRVHHMLRQPPVILRVRPETLFLPHDPSRTHPMVGKLRLWACRVSGTFI